LPKKKRKKKRKKKKEPIPKDTKVAVKSESIKRVIAKLEKKRFNIPITFLYILGLGFIRVALEDLLGNQDMNIYMYAHLVAFFLLMYLFGLMVMSFFSKENPGKVANLINCGFWIIVLPPIFDRLATGFFGYTYLSADSFITNLTTFGIGNVGDIGFGLLIEIIAIFMFVGAYVFIKTKSVVRTVLAALVMYLFMLIISTPGLYFPFPLAEEGWAQFPSGGTTVYPNMIHLHIFAFLWYSFLCVLICLAIAYLHHRGVFKGLVFSNRPIRTLHFTLMAVVGYAVALGTGAMNLLSYPYYIDLAFLLVTVAVVASSWQFATMINDIHDVEIDKESKAERPLVRGLVEKSHYLEVAVCVALVAIFSSVILAFLVPNGFIFPLLVIVFLLIAVAYSTPPIRFRNNPFHTVAIGLASATVFLLGFLTPFTAFTDVSGLLIPSQISMTGLGSEAWLIVVVILVAFSVAPMITDLRDYEADKKQKVRSVYVVFGLDTGKKIVSGLIVVLFLLPLLLFHSLLDIAVFVIFAVVSFIAFYKYESHEVVFICYFAVLIYAVTRYLGLF
jgi:4-hydroxybenzoate polyprenyltransferase